MRCSKLCSDNILVAIFLMALPAFANIGGEFLYHGLSGLSIGATGVLSASTQLNCDEIRCDFKTVYKTNAPNSLFSGHFYGARVDSVFANGSLLRNHDSLSNDSMLFGSNNVLHDFGESGIIRFPLECPVGPDSLITITGIVSQDSAVVWGLGFLRRISDLRHLVFAPKDFKIPSFSTGYLIAPIDSFSTLEYVKVRWDIKGYDSLRRKIHFAKPLFKERDSACYVGTACFDSIATHADRRDYRKRRFSAYQSFVNSNDSMIFAEVIPDAITLEYSKPKASHDVFSIGGPIAFLGNYEGNLSWSAGWEFAINLPKEFSIYPSASISQYNDRVGAESWLRIALLYCSAGVGITTDQQVMWRAGLDVFGPIGFEASNKSILFKISI